MKSSFIQSVLCLSFIAALVGSPALAQKAGGQSGGGGNHRGLDASAALKLVPSALKKYGADLVSQQQLSEIEQIVNSKNTLIMMTDKAPIACGGGLEQKGTAYSSSGETVQMISIYNKEWDSMNGELELQIPLMAHEIAVLKGWEKTGYYGSISDSLRNRLRKSGASLTTSTPYEDCMKKLNNAPDVISPLDKNTICSSADIAFNSCYAQVSRVQGVGLSESQRVFACSQAGAGFDACYALVKQEPRGWDDLQKVLVCGGAKAGFQDCYNHARAAGSSSADSITACGVIRKISN